MPKQSEKSRNDRSLRPPPERSGANLTRENVAAVIGCSTSTVRRMEQTGELPFEVGADGVHRFDPAEVTKVAMERQASVVDPSREGTRDARVFEMLDDGHTLRAVVKRLHVPLDVAERLVRAWREDGKRDFVVTIQCRAELNALIPFEDAADLVAQVRALDADNQRLTRQNENATNKIGDLLNVVAAVSSGQVDVGKRLEELRAQLTPDEIETLERARAYWRERQTPE